MTSPGLGYNVLSVGAYDDQNDLAKTPPHGQLLELPQPWVVQQRPREARARRAGKEGIRAVLSATTYRDIEGYKVTSDRDGAGGIDVDKAFKTVSGTNGGWVGKNYNCSSPSPFIMGTPTFTAGRRTRVALSWQTNSAAYGLWGAQPGADVDLDVIGPDGALIASSIKYDRTTEIVDFTAPKNGIYKIRALRVRCTGSTGSSPGSIAAAWYNAPA